MKKRVGDFFIYIFLILLTIITIIPFYIVVVNSTHTSFDIVTNINFIPGDALLENISIMNKFSNVWRGLFNSIVISTAFTLASAYFGAMAAFGFAKYQFKLKNALFTLMLLSMIVTDFMNCHATAFTGCH